MVLEKKEATVGYHCPACGGSVRSAVGVLALSGDMFRLRCSCGESCMTINIKRDGDVQLTVPCLICPRPHVYNVSEKAFFSRELLTFSCGLSGLDVCYIGKEAEVNQAMLNTEAKMAQILQDAGIGEQDLQKDGGEEDEDVLPQLNVPDNHVYDLVHYVVADIAAEEKIYCRCEKGQGEYDVLPEEGGVRVVCANCGASRHIDCSNSLFANSFFELESITLE